MPTRWSGCAAPSGARAAKNESGRADALAAFCLTSSVMKKIRTLAVILTSTLSLPHIGSAQLPLPAPSSGEPQPPSQSVPYSPPTTTPELPPVRTETPRAASQSPSKPQAGKRASLTVGGVSVRGLSDVAAIKKLKRAHAKELSESVTLWDGKAKHLVRRAALGASIPYYKLLAKARAQQQSGGDVPLAFEVDLKRAQRAMKALAPKVNHAPAHASLDVDANGRVLLKGGEGATLAVEGSALRIKAALENEPPQNYVSLVVARQPGASTLRQFKYLLAEYSTPYDAAIRGRTNNLKMAAHNINGEIVQAGETFSTNQAIGPRNAAAGWREAKMFVDGQVVDGVGAGICQAATTLYNAALLANLPITERHPHSFRVKYAPASRDATIYWGHKDMKFRNDTGGPIYVQTFVRHSRFYVRFYSTQPLKADVAIESRILSTRKGTSSEAYRIVRNGDAVKREKLSRDYYRPPVH
jgi:vancomycin resistance protein YoaR